MAALAAHATDAWGLALIALGLVIGLAIYVDLAGPLGNQQFAEIHGALLDSDTNTKTKKPLIIWLHGGPERQTSVGYHSYLSYGVYDEMLERFVRAGEKIEQQKVGFFNGFGRKMGETARCAHDFAGKRHSSTGRPREWTTRTRLRYSLRPGWQGGIPSGRAR
jgi:hypothetical protein